MVGFFGGFVLFYFIIFFFYEIGSHFVDQQTNNPEFSMKLRLASNFFIFLLQPLKATTPSLWEASLTQIFLNTSFFPPPNRTCGVLQTPRLAFLSSLWNPEHLSKVSPAQCPFCPLPPALGPLGVSWVELFIYCPELVTSYQLLWDHLCYWMGQREVNPPGLGCAQWAHGVLGWLPCLL